MNKIDKTLQLIKETKIAVGQELERCRKGLSTVGTCHQLLEIQKKLEEMEISIVHCIVPTQPDQGWGIGRMIVDSWPLGDMLSYQSADRLDQIRQTHGQGQVLDRFLTFKQQSSKSNLLMLF